MNPEERSWTITEKYFHSQQMPFYETILTIGNGYLATRGTFEEGYPDESPSTLIHGIFNHHPADLVPDLANTPAWFALDITVDEEPFGLDKGQVLGYWRQLDLRNGVLRRQVLWQSPKGQVIRLDVERLASMADPHILVQRVTLTALDPVAELRLNARLDTSRALNQAYTATGHQPVSHWGDEITGQPAPGICWWQGHTNQSQYTVVMAQQVDANQPDVEWAALTTENGPGSGVAVNLAAGEHLILTRYVSVATSRDSDDVRAYALDKLQAAVAQGEQAILANHQQVWAKLWQDMDIQIEGDEFAQLAIRFVTYHLLIAAPRHSDQVSIGAKTLSGPSYKGHVFWDTELFMLPIFTLSRPDIARNLLMYRYHNLAGARRKAQEAGYRGAMFPWESTDTGEETTPRWTLPDAEGNRIRIWTGDNELHISSDIAYAVWQYWRWTGDDEFMARHGAEMLLDTAVFWASRAEWQAEAGRYELSQQIGPDEFHENVDNPVYTNRLVAWHMHHAIQTLDWLRAHDPAGAEALCSQLGIDDELLARWQDIAAKMYIPHDEERGVLEQFEGFFERELVDVQAYRPRTRNMDVILGHARTQASQVIKQADVIMLIALLGDKLGDREALLRNWETYVPRTAHDSSLSAAIHAWVAAQLDLVDEAYTFWVEGAGIDLENNKDNVGEGIHAAACGGLRQAVLFGFAGLHLDEHGDWQLDPGLPPWWRSLAFTFYHHGQRQTVRIDNQADSGTSIKTF